MAEIDINNVIQISISAPSVGAKQVNLSTIALFTNDPSEVVAEGDYAVYKSVSGIASDFGTGSNIYKQAVAIFSQSPNILSNSGYIIAIPVKSQVSVDASAGYGITQDINLQNFMACTDGVIKIRVDDTREETLRALNFSAVRTMSALAGVFNTAIAGTATYGKATTGTITVSGFTSVSDGSFTITLNGGTASEITGLDFTDAESVDDIAEIIDTALTTAGLNVACEAYDTDKLRFTSGISGSTSSVLLGAGTTGTSIYSQFGTPTKVDGIDALGVTVSVENLNALRFTSSTTGASSQVVVSAGTISGTEVDLSGSSYLGTLSYVQGMNSYTGRERLVTAIQRARTMVYAHCVIPCYDLDTSNNNEEAISASDYIQTQPMMLALADNSLTCCDAGGLFERIKNKSNTKTRCFAYFYEKGTTQDARNMASAYMGRGLCVNFEGSGTALTMQLKALATIEPSPDITETLLSKAVNVGADVYCSIYGVNAVLSHGANDFFDNVYNDNWLLTALQVAGFNALRYANTKIPQTNEGIDALVTAYKAVITQGVNAGCFAPGTWNISYPFGDPEIFALNIETFGYYIYPEPLSEQTQDNRDARKAPFISIALKRAGAVHSSAVTVYINN